MRELPVQASREFRRQMLQSVVPDRWTTARDVFDARGDMRAVMGLVVVRRW